MSTAKTVLITQRLGDMMDIMAQWLRDVGYNVNVCTGPGDTQNLCWAFACHDCTFWVQADLVIYDPWFATAYAGPGEFALERQRHPEMPVLIWGPSAIPADVADLANRGLLEVLPLELTREQLVEAVERNIGLPDLLVSID